MPLLAISDPGAGRDAGLDGGPPYSQPDAGPGSCDGSSCDVPVAMRCDDPTSVAPQAICGCGRSDQSDADADGVPDCIDFCPGVPDQTDDAVCACAKANEDADADGVANCQDRCPFDAAKLIAGMCGCGVPDSDGDADGVPDCLDLCPGDADKSEPGVCGCGTPDSDSDLDGTFDCNDRCSGVDDASYVPDSSCGVGYCQATNTPSTCRAGVETACVAGEPISDTDGTCDGRDDDCDGSVDEDYGAMSHVCGQGACARTGELSCVAGMVQDSCVAGSALGPDDATCDAVDDDCDGLVDENVMSTPSTCAMGACAATGTIACVDGQFVDSCQASTPIDTVDATCDNVDDDCNGAVDEDYVAVATNCGTGACARTGMRTCSAGVEIDSCVAPAPATSVDSSCNGVDDDCDGRVDEEYASAATSCGQGVCASTGVKRCQSGSEVDSCVAGSPTSSVDDAAVPGNGLDDDCDGQVDEDLPACDTTSRSYEAGDYMLTIPGNCRRVTVELWGGGGGGGQSAGVAGTGGRGGPGGYAKASVLVQTPLQLFVGSGGSNNCNTAGTNAGSGSYNGGSGGTGVGADGADGNVSGGGSGGSPSTGYRGGNGYYGGGGGGEGSGGLGASGAGGGGGAASVLLVNGIAAAVAGGGGGGGGGQSISLLGTLAAAGGAGGSGCRGNGQAPNANGGGGGGGGVCSGSSTQAGSGTTAANAGQIPSGRASGGSANCGGGGAGYAIVTFSAN